MTQDEIIEMARQANILWQIGYENPDMTNWRNDIVRELSVFAKLVAAKEREEIKSLAEKELLNTSTLMSMPPQSSAAWNILQAIRARGEA